MAKSKKPKNKIWVGCRGMVSSVFFQPKKPTEADNLPYDYVIGPFRTQRGAKFMVHMGRNNPHCQTVEDAERSAKDPLNEAVLANKGLIRDWSM